MDIMVTLVLREMLEQTHYILNTIVEMGKIISQDDSAGTSSVHQTLVEKSTTHINYK